MKKHTLHALLSILKSDLLKNSFIIFLSFLGAGVITFLAELFLSKSLGPVDWGQFRTVVYLFTFSQLLIELGINVTLTKYVAEYKNKSKGKIGYLVKSLLKIRLFSYSFVILLILVLRDYLSLTFLGSASLGYLFIGSIFFIGFSFFSTIGFIVLGYQKFKLFAKSQFLISISSAILAILMSPLGIFYTIIGWSFGFLLGNIINIRFFLSNKTIEDTEKFDVKKLFWKFSIPIYITNIPNVLFSFVIPFLNLFFSPLLVGYYSFAFIFYSASLLIPRSISYVVFPKVSELDGVNKHRDAKEILKKSFIPYSFVFLVGLLLIFSASDWLFGSFFTEYLPSIMIFKVLSVTGLGFGFLTIYVNYLQGLGRIKMIFLVALIQNLSLLFISFYLLSSMS